MASMAISLHLKPKPSYLNPTLLRFFSSSSKPPDPTPDNNPSPSQSQSQSQSQSEDSFSSFFSDVKSKLNQQPPPPQSPSSNADIRRKLAQFHPKSTASPPSPQPFSLQGLYQKRERVSFDAIRDNLKKFAPDNKRSDSLWRLKNRDPKSAAIGGSGVLPAAVFGREMNERVAGESPEMRKTTQLFMKSYEHDELGKRLTELRPKNLKEFSIKELSERLVKVREIEEAENATNGRGLGMIDLRNSLRSIEMNKQEKNKHIQRLDALSHLGRTESFMLSPPKEHLVEKYFHPDNMSSAEKLKIELQKVRDEFKMSETDCGSARVQVAQLTTKIKHLTTALHKKDKHSRKGLQEMVQRRKKLLKYLRRTDWDSYCLVLSKLGLRDRPDLKIK